MTSLYYSYYYCVLLNHHRQLDIDGFGRKAGVVIARLIAQFAKRHAGSIERAGGDLEFRYQLKVAREHG